MRTAYLSLFLLILASCAGNTKKPAANDTVISIYKLWQFKKLDTTFLHNKNYSAAWIGNNTLDLRNKDTLKFNYGGTHNKPTIYPCKIQHDTIFIQNKPGYKILTLTADELHLLVVFKGIGDKKATMANATVMIYTAK